MGRVRCRLAPRRRDLARQRRDAQSTRTWVVPAPGSQDPRGPVALPEPDGRVWLANGIYAGWQPGAQPSLTDPREPAPSVEEVGRGPLPDAMGRFTAVRQVRNGVVLEYVVKDVNIRERITASDSGGASRVTRQFRVEPSSEDLTVVLGTTADDIPISVSGVPAAALVSTTANAPGQAPVWSVPVGAHKETIEFAAVFGAGEAALQSPADRCSGCRAGRRRCPAGSPVDLERGICRRRRGAPA